MSEESVETAGMMQVLCSEDFEIGVKRACGVPGYCPTCRFDPAKRPQMTHSYTDTAMQAQVTVLGEENARLASANAELQKRLDDANLMFNTLSAELERVKRQWIPLYDPEPQPLGPLVDKPE